MICELCLEAIEVPSFNDCHSYSYYVPIVSRIFVLSHSYLGMYYENSIFEKCSIKINCNN